MLFTSGQKQRPRLAQKVYAFMLDKEPILKYVQIVVHHKRLKSENVTGWEYADDDDEFMIEIDRSLSRNEYIKTLIHELIHVRQDLKDQKDDYLREDEAFCLEEFYSWVFDTTKT